MHARHSGLRSTRTDWYRPDHTSKETRRPPTDSVLPRSSLIASAASIEAITPAAAPRTPTVSQVSSAPAGALAPAACAPSWFPVGFPDWLPDGAPDSRAHARQAVWPGRTVSVTPYLATTAA